MDNCNAAMLCSNGGGRGSMDGLVAGKTDACGVQGNMMSALEVKPFALDHTDWQSPR